MGGCLYICVLVMVMAAASVPWPYPPHNDCSWIAYFEKKIVGRFIDMAVKMSEQFHVS